MMKKKNLTTEEKAISILKRTGSDINQLFNELTTELSEEFLNSDESFDYNKIKESLNIINYQKELFLNSMKKALNILQDKDIKKEKDEEEKKEEEPLTVINEKSSDNIIKPL